jgi:arsenate reductase-like glutaredoxin family protein
MNGSYTDLRTDGIGASTIAEWVAALGWEAVLNKRSTTWRNLPESAREIGSPAAAVDLLAAHPTLIKRPVIEFDGEVSVGFGPDVIARLERAAAS